MDSSNDRHFAELRFNVPDFSVRAEDRAMFAGPAKLDVSIERTELHDLRTAPDLVKGPEGLDVQGFTYVNHRSALSNSDQWFTEKKFEEVYIPEVEALICRLTGAKAAVVNNAAFRRKLATKQTDPMFYYKRGSEIDQIVSGLPRDVALVAGKTVDSSIEPARFAHIDYTPQGLRDSARYCRKDITAAAQRALDAEDRDAKDVPRYAAYSVWRPLKTVKRDPLAVCDWRTVDKKELCEIPYRAPSGVNESGEYMMNMWGALPPAKPTKQKWYWIPEQKEDEVLVIKFADTQAEIDPSIAGGAPHASPEVEGTENEKARESIECRVLAFW